MPAREYDTSEVAELLGVGVITVHRYCRDRGLGRRVKGRWIITAAELLRFRRVPLKPGWPKGTKREKPRGKAIKTT